MPPKKSTKKDKKGKAKTADGDVKDELWDQVIALREELEQMKKQKNQFRHERDNCMLSWENSKKRLEQHRAQLRQRQRVKEEREKHFQDQIKILGEQMKHVQLEQHNAISELQIEAAASERLKMNQNMVRELALQQSKMDLQVTLLEIRSIAERCIKILMLKHEEAMEARYEYNHIIITQMQMSHVEKSHQTIMEMSQMFNAELTQVMDDITAKANFQIRNVRQRWKALYDFTDELGKGKKKEGNKPGQNEGTSELETDLNFLEAFDDDDNLGAGVGRTFRF